MERLTEELIRPFLTEDKDVKNVVVIYSGRFQPFHAGHYHAYDFLVKKFGKKNVFITTSNKTEPEKSPLNFNEKKLLITKFFGVPSSQVVQVKNPYNPVEVKSKFDPETTAMVVGLGEKDADRLLRGKYYQKYTGKNMKGFDEEGYVVILPQLQLKLGGKTVSGTVMRDLIKKNDPSIKKAFHKFDDKVFNKVRRRFLGEAVVSESIKHIEDIKPEMLLKFLELWKLDNTEFEVNEKVDGHFFKFGMRGNKFFTGSKTKEFGAEGDYPSLYFYADFKKYHSLLKKLPYKEIVKKLAKKHGTNPNPKSIVIESESIPSWDHNIVMYDPEVIGDGIIVLFKILLDDVPTPIPFHEDFAKEINKKSKITFYANPKVNLNKVHFNEKYTIRLRNMIEKYGNILSKPARKPHEKKIKQQIQRIANMIGKRMKNQVLKVDFKRAFGEEDEGLVLYMPDGNIVKIVDKNRFTKRKEENWRYIDKIQVIERELKKNGKAEPSKFDKYLATFEKGLNSIEKEFKKEGDKYISIEKKKQDTVQQIDMVRRQVKEMKRLLKTKSPEEVYTMYINRQLATEALWNVLQKNHIIEQFLMENDIKDVIEEGTAAGRAPVDDGPPTFYKTFGEYKKVSTSWLNSIFEETGWRVIEYILSKGAIDPEIDYTMSYTTVPAVAYGKTGDGKGYSDPVEKYKQRIQGINRELGWEIVQWLGISGNKTTGVDVEAPVPAGADADVDNSYEALRNVYNMNEVFSKEWWNVEMKKAFLIKEGGNVFNKVNSVVPKDNLNPTIKKALALVGMSKIKFDIVGNKNKPLLGDIDIAVNSQDVAKVIGYKGSDKKEFWAELKKYLEGQKTESKIYAGLSQFHILSPLVDKSGKQMKAISPEGKTMKEPGYVQIDVMTGDLNWMKKALSASDMDSKYKAKYRNVLLADVFSQLVLNTKDKDVKRKFQINWKTGVELVDFTTNEKGKREKIKVRKVMGDMDKLTKFLFGPKYTFKDISSFEKLYKLINSKDFKFPKIRKDIFKQFKKTVERYKFPMPKEMAKW